MAVTVLFKPFVTTLCITLLLAGGAARGESSHVVNPTGSFFPREDGTLLYFEGVDVFSGAGSALQNGVTGAFYSMGASMGVTAFLAALPGAGSSALLTTTMMFLWKYRFPLMWWHSYRMAIEGLWNSQSRRVGTMPVYFSSPALQRSLIVNWRFPYTDERPVQLDIVAVPQRHFYPQAHKLASHQERGWLSLSDAMNQSELVRLVVSVKDKRLILSAQHSTGQWFHRNLPRPEQPVLAEHLMDWNKRAGLDVAFSLLSRSSLDYISNALECEESDIPPWQDTRILPDLALWEGEQGSLWQIDDAGRKSCTFLTIADNSTRYGGLAGYMGLNTKSCANRLILFQQSNTEDFENDLIENNYVQIVPYWFSTLILRAVEESVSIGVRSVVEPSMPGLVNKVSPLSVPEIQSSSWLEFVETQCIRSVAIGKPNLDSEAVHGKVICQWQKGSGSQGL